MANDTAAIRAWAIDNGYDVEPRGRLAQDIKDAYHRATLQPLPGDGEDFDIVDGDDVGLPPLQEAPGGSEQEAPGAAWWEQDGAPPEPGPVIPDPAPAKIGKGRSKSGAKKPTAAVAADVRGQLTLWLGTGASIFQAVDPICGGVAVQVAGPAADAWTDVILQSPRAIEFFTGPAGMAMLVLRGVYATMPLLNVVWAHHIARTIKAEDQPQPERQYAA